MWGTTQHQCSVSEFKGKKEKKVLLLFKVLFSFYFPATSEIEMYHPCSLLPHQDWSTDTCWMAKVSPQQGAECVFSRKRRKENKAHCDGALNGEWRPCWVSPMMHGHHNFTRADCTFHCLDKMGHHEPESGAMRLWSTTDVTAQAQHHVGGRPWLRLLTVSQQHV